LSRPSSGLGPEGSSVGFGFLFRWGGLLVGFCGGFTTMSGLAVWQLYGTFNWFAMAAMFALGLLAYFAGSAIGSRMSAK
jgi:fluoride ion exporter CrcB/FEX